MNEILKKYKIKAKKSLGQNFLIDDSKLDFISEYINLDGKNIIEVGPGYGALTEKIINKNIENLTLVELDKDMCFVLKERFLLDKKNIKLLNEDILKHKVNFENYSVIANIPYYITSPIINNFLYKQENIPEFMIILMQKEVAEKIVKKSGKSSLISFLVEKKSNSKIILDVPKNCFSPSPKVDSSVVFFELDKKYDEINDDLFLKFLKIIFKEPRKTLLNNLKKSGYEKKSILDNLNSLKIDENIRPEKLNLDDVIKLIKAFNHI